MNMPPAGLQALRLSQKKASFFNSKFPSKAVQIVARHQLGTFGRTHPTSALYIYFVLELLCSGTGVCSSICGIIGVSFWVSFIATKQAIG
jgi:hypothetical protein